MWQTWNILTIHNLEYASLTQFFMVRSVMLKDVGVYVYSPDQGSQRVRGWHTPTFKHTYYTCLLWSFNWRYQVPKFYNLQLSLKTIKSQGGCLGHQLWHITSKKRRRWNQVQWRLSYDFADFVFVLLQQSLQTYTLGSVCSRLISLEMKNHKCLNRTLSKKIIKTKKTEKYISMGKPWYNTYVCICIFMFVPVAAACQKINGCQAAAQTLLKFWLKIAFR